MNWLRSPVTTMLADVDALVPLIEDRWDADLATWVDAGPGSSTSGRIRTADPLCALLVVDDTDQRAAAVASLADSADHGGAFGPAAFTRPSRCTTRRPTGGGRCGPSWPTCSGGPSIADRPRRRSGRSCGDERSPERCAQGSPSTGTAIRPPEAGRPRSPGPDSHSCWRRPARPRLVFGVEAAHLRTQLDDRARGFLRLVPPEGLRLASAQRTDGRRRRARRLARTSAIPTRMMRSPNDTTCLANDSGIVSPNEASEVSASLNS